MADKLKRAYSPIEVMKMKHKTLDFDGEWENSMGKPSAYGTWLIWGNSGNGKSSFVMQLAKYLCRFGKVIYDSLEESTSLSFQMSLKRHGMSDVSRRLMILDREDMEQLSERLKKKKSPGMVIIDSFQYSGLNYNSYKRLKEEHPGKLFIFISHAEGTKPAGRTAKTVEYDADVKIYVEGFKATCKSRYMVTPGVPFVIWKEGAEKYSMDGLGECCFVTRVEPDEKTKGQRPAAQDDERQLEQNEELKGDGEDGQVSDSGEK